MSLTRYRSKRDFSLTREPKGAKARARTLALAQVLFVIQKHAARRLHYDFRLEMDGVLKSWAVPKGIPLTQGDKRLAVQVEDHPVKYGGFEGSIPSGNYGAGTVMLWDAGICQVLHAKPQTALRQGKLVLRLQGQKLTGHWTLVRMARREARNDNEWLLIKTGEDADPISPRLDDRSIVSGRTMNQIAATDESPCQSPRHRPVPRPAGKREPRPRRTPVRQNA